MAETAADVIEIDASRGREAREDDYELSPTPEEEAAFEYDERSPNLVEDFSMHREGVELLKKLGETIRTNFDDDWDAADEGREQEAKDWKIFTCDLPEKSFPFENGANIALPLMFENVSRIQFRMVGELFGDWQNVFGVLPMGPDDEDKAAILSKHGNYQLREGIPGFQGQMGRALLQYLVPGDLTLATSYDPARRCPVVEVLTRDEFVTPYAYTAIASDYSDVPRLSRVRRYHRHELEQMKGIWFGVEDMLDGRNPSWDDDPEQNIRDAADVIEGIIRPDGETSAPYKIIEYEGWETLPNQDGQRYIKCFYDYSTGAILSLTIHEEEDWKDVERYRRQLDELDAYREAYRTYEQATVVTEGAKESLNANPDLGAGDKVGLQGMFGEGEMAPTPPKWLSDPTDPQAQPDKPRMVPIRLNAHGLCIEPVAGNLGLGFGRVQANFNRAANTVIDQFVDGATLNNGSGIITSQLVDFERPFSVGPGVVNKVSGVTGGELRNNIMPMEVGPPSQGLIQVLELVQQLGQSSMQAPDVLSGESGKSGETFRGIAFRGEQATKQLSVLTRRFAVGPLTQTLKNIAKLNGIYLSDDEVFLVNDHKLNEQTNQMESVWTQQSVSREMYQRSYDVEIKADLKYGSDAAKVADADQLLQGAQTIPQLAMNPAFMYAAIKKNLEARDMTEMIPLLGPPPPPPTAPMAPPPPEQPSPGGGPSGPAGPPPEGGPVQ